MEQFTLIYAYIVIYYTDSWEWKCKLISTNVEYKSGQSFGAHVSDKYYVNSVKEHTNHHVHYRFDICAWHYKVWNTS